MLQPSRCGEGGHAGGLEGPKPPGATCPGPGGARAPALQAGVARGAGGLEGGEATWRHPSGHMATGGVWNLLQVLFALFAHGHRRRKPSAPGAFCTVLSMSTGGVSHLLQVLFGLFCSWSKWLKPPAFCAKSCKGLVEARGAFRVCLVQNPAFCGFQVARRESGGVEPPTWDHLCTTPYNCVMTSLRCVAGAAFVAVLL